MGFLDLAAVFIIPWVFAALVNTIDEWQKPLQGSIKSIQVSDSISAPAAAVWYFAERLAFPIRPMVW